MASNDDKKHRGRPSDHPPIQIWKEVDGHWCRFKDTYETYADAARAIGGDLKEVRKCALGKALTHKGYAFRFDDDDYMRQEIERSRNSHGRDYSKATSRYPGIYYSVTSGKWRAQIYINGSPVSLGAYRTEEEAIEMQRFYCNSKGLQWPLGDLKW